MYTNEKSADEWSDYISSQGKGNYDELVQVFSKYAEPEDSKTLYVRNKKILLVDGVGTDISNVLN